MADDARPLHASGARVDLGPRERLLSVAEFDRMGELGFFPEPGKHELWDGRVMMSPPPGSPHIDNGMRFTRALVLALNGAGMDGAFGLAPDGGLQIGDTTVLGPDFLIAKLPMDTARRLTGADVALVVEVSHATLHADLNAKREKYAAADVPEYWVIDVEGKALHVFRDPKGVVYADAQVLRDGDKVAPLFAPQIELVVADFL